MTLAAWKDLGSPLERLRRALTAAGFQSRGAGGFRLGARGGPLLRASPGADGWLAFASSPLPLGDCDPGAFLFEEVAPAGPFRLVPGGPPGTVRLVADHPAALAPEVDAIPGALAAPASAVRDPAAVWAEDLAGALARLAGMRAGMEPPGSGAAGDALPGSEAIHPDGIKNDLIQTNINLDIVDWLGARGWVAAATGDEAHVNLQGAAYFQQIQVRSDGAGRHRLDMELVETSAWPEVSMAAAVAVARLAAGRLRLARLVLRRGAPSGGARRALVAQVHLGRQPLASPWLETGLEALRAAAAVLATELPALADPALAEWVVRSSTSSGNSR